MKKSITPQRPNPSIDPVERDPVVGRQARLRRQRPRVVHDDGQRGDAAQRLDAGQPGRVVPGWAAAGCSVAAGRPPCRLVVDDTLDGHVVAPASRP